MEPASDRGLLLSSRGLLARACLAVRTGSPGSLIGKAGCGGHPAWPPRLPLSPSQPSVSLPPSWPLPPPLPTSPGKRCWLISALAVFCMASGRDRNPGQQRSSTVGGNRRTMESWWRACRPLAHSASHCISFGHTLGPIVRSAGAGGRGGQPGPGSGWAADMTLSAALWALPSGHRCPATALVLKNNVTQSLGTKPNVTAPGDRVGWAGNEFPPRPLCLCS